MRTAVVVVSSETEDAAAGGAVLLVLSAAAVSAVVALAVLWPVAQDGGPIEPSHDGLRRLRCDGF